METVTLSKDEAARVLAVLRMTDVSMRELADAIPVAMHDDYDLLTSSMATEVRECVDLMERKVGES